MTKYIVIAYNYEQYIRWCRENNVNPSGGNIKFFWGIESVRGVEEYEVIFLEGWYESKLHKKDPNLTDYVAQRAFRVWHEQDDKPIVSEKGEIIEWTVSHTTI